MTTTAPPVYLDVRITTNVKYAYASEQDRGIYLIDGNEYHASELHEDAPFTPEETE